MENLSKNTSPDPKRFVAPETSTWKEIVSDPAALVILYALRMREEFDLAELEKVIPESLTDLFDKIVALLSAEGMVEVTETKLRLTRPKEMMCIFDTEALSKSVPQINSFISAKGLEGAKNIYGNGCRFFFYPLEQEEEALAILRETRAKFQRLIEKGFNSKSAKMGYATFACSQISPEDFT